jgi:hypothetical protein
MKRCERATFFVLLIYIAGCVSLVAEALCCKLEGHWFETRYWSLWIYLILPAALGPEVYCASKRNEYQRQKKCSWGVEHGYCLRLTSWPSSVSQLSRLCGILNILQPCRPPWPVMGIALLLFPFSFLTFLITKILVNFYQTALQHNPDDITVCSDLCEDLGSLMSLGHITKHCLYRESIEMAHVNEVLPFRLYLFDILVVLCGSHVLLVFVYLSCFCIHSLSWFICLVSFNGHWEIAFHFYEDRDRCSGHAIAHHSCSVHNV